MSQHSSLPNDSLIDQATNSTVNNPIATAQTKKRHKPPHFERTDEMRVVVTGMGAVTPLGLDVESSWAKLLKGESGITSISHFDATGYRAQIAGVIKDFEPKQYQKA